MPLQDPIQELFSSKLKDHASEVPGHVWTGIAQSLAPRPWWKSWWTAAAGTAAVVATVSIGVLSKDAPTPPAAEASIAATIPAQTTLPIDTSRSTSSVLPPPTLNDGVITSEEVTCCAAIQAPLIELPITNIDQDQAAEMPVGNGLSESTVVVPNPTGRETAATAETPLEEKQWKLSHSIINAEQLLFYCFHSDAGEGTWQWDFGDGTTGEGKDIMHSFSEEGTYTVTLTKISSNGILEKSLSQEIEAYRPLKLKLPTVFTPNEDGRNDVFSISEESTGVKEIQQLLIRTRDGQEVIRTEGKPWNGQWWNGEEAPAGVYIYVIRIAGTNGKISEHSGTVQLLR